MNDLCIIVLPNRSQNTKKALEDLGLHDATRRLKHMKAENRVAIPIKTNNKSEKEIEEILGKAFSSWSCPVDFEIKNIELQSAKKLLIKTPETVLHESVRTFLVSKGQPLTPDLAKDLPTHWEIHGDLALLPGTAFRSAVWQSLGSDLWQVVAKSLSCKRLAQRDVVSRDGFRSPQVVLLCGNSGWVEQLDNGIRYTYDITKCMFSSGNITEKMRVAGFDCTDEVVVDLYAGIGYFTLPYLVYTGARHLHACEWNPDAVEALHRNLQLNNVMEKCTIHVGDNRKVCPKGIADRVNLGLIPSSKEGWIPACAALKSDCGGTLHIHYNVNTRPQTGKQTNASVSLEPDKAFRQEAKCMVSSNIPIGQKSSIRYKQLEDDSNADIIVTSSTNNTFPSCDNDDVSVVKQELLNHNENRDISRVEITDENTGWSQAECTQPEVCDDFDNESTKYLKSGETNQYKSLNSCQNSDMGRKSKWLPWACEVALEIRSLLEKMHRNQWKTDILHVEHVKSYAPHVNHVVLDLRCTPLM